MDWAIYPAKMGIIKLNAALPIQKITAATGLVWPKLPPALALPANVSIKKPKAISTPPPTTKGSIWDTPFIRCLYTLWPKLSFSSSSPAGAAPPSAW